ncbi:MAG: hypothetical protein HN337_01795 [Deltaproteobacteria bacterium]|nr:hypothetical protein [Deltaproteobacteria bacterium]
MSTVNFQPTFAHAFYRAANTGCVRLATAALMGQPLAQAEISALLPFGEAMGISKLPVAATVHSSFADVVDAEGCGNLRDGLLAQTQMAWGVSQMSEKDLADAARLISMSDSTTANLFAAKQEILAQVRDAMHVATYVPGRRSGHRRSSISGEELLWTLKRHFGNLGKAVKELGVDYGMMKIIALRMMEEDPDFKRAVEDEYLQGGVFQPTALMPRVRELEILDLKRPYYQGRILFDGATLLTESGHLKRGDVDLFLEMARGARILDLQYTVLFDPPIHMKTTLSAELRGFNDRAGA